MNNTYKDQFTEWPPAYPVVFHFLLEKCEFDFNSSLVTREFTMRTHNITINEINKAMKK